MFVPNEDDVENLAMLETLGLRPETAIRVALTSLAVEMTPVALALRADAAAAS